MARQNLDIFEPHIVSMEGQNMEPGIGMLVITSLRMKGRNLEPTDAIVMESLSSVTSLQASLPIAEQNLEPRTWKAATVAELLSVVILLQVSLCMAGRNLEQEISVCGHLGSRPYPSQGGTWIYLSPTS